MSDLTVLRDHCRKHATKTARLADSLRLDRSTAGRRRRRELEVALARAEKTGALWTQIADEIDAYLAESDPAVPTPDDAPLWETP